jgi:hypothetical protein
VSLLERRVLRWWDGLTERERDAVTLGAAIVGAVLALSLAAR